MIPLSFNILYFFTKITSATPLDQFFGVIFGLFPIKELPRKNGYTLNQNVGSMDVRRHSKIQYNLTRLNSTISDNISRSLFPKTMPEHP